MQMNVDAQAENFGRTLRTEKSTGVIIGHDPKLKTYVVRILGYGEKRAVKAVIYGAERAYLVNTQVVCAKYPGTDWVIEGEIPQISARTGSRATEIEETNMDRAGDAEGILNRAPDPDAISYRPVDKDLVPETAILEGDVLIQNKTLKQKDRSFLKLFGMGDFVAKVAPTCVFYMNRVLREVRIRASSMIREFTGYTERITVERTTENLGQTTRTQSVRRTANDETPATLIEGTIPLTLTDTSSLQTLNVAATGKRLAVGDLAVELDQELGTIRLNQNSDGEPVSLQIGSFIAENSSNPTSGQQNPDGPVVDAEGTQVTAGFHIKQGDTEILLTADRVDLKKGDQLFKLTPDGLAVSTTNFTVDAQTINLNGSEVSVNASGSLGLQGNDVAVDGTSVDVNATTITNTASTINLNA